MDRDFIAAIGSDGLDSSRMKNPPGISSDSLLAFEHQNDKSLFSAHECRSPVRESLGGLCAGGTGSKATIRWLGKTEVQV